MWRKKKSFNWFKILLRLRFFLTEQEVLRFPSFSNFAIEKFAIEMVFHALEKTKFQFNSYKRLEK